MFEVSAFAPATARQVMFDVKHVRLARDAKCRNPQLIRIRERDGSILRMKSDAFPRRRRLSDELLNCGEDSRKLLTRFLPFARPLPKRTMQSIQRRPRTSYSSHGTRAAQHAGKHIATPCSVKA